MATEQPRAVWCCSTCGAIYHKDYPRCPTDGAEVVMVERDPLLGSAIGHYTIDKLVGEGGMGRVYLAHHAHLPNKRYALKVLLGDHAASVAMRARFTREAERASQLDHPNVVKVVDFGQTPHGLLYIVMDFVEGPSLVSLIDQLPMPPARAIAVSRAICSGLAHAHAAGIVHRDLKPENILVSAGPDGPVPRIVDFGLAMSVDQTDARLTESGMTMGTPAFAAPEQLSGKPIDHRADLYALGMTMFEMLTGGLAPFEGHIMEMMSARTTRDAPRISERAPDLAIPRELEDIVAQLTRRRPADRYASARDVIDALDRVRIGPEAHRSTARIAERGRSRWWLAGALMACAGGAAVWYEADLGGSGSSPAAAARVDLAPVARPAAHAAAASAPATVPGRAEPPAVAVAEPAAARDTAAAPPAERAPARHRPRPSRPPVRVEPAAVAVAPPVEARRNLAPLAPPTLPALPAPPPPPPAPLGELRATIDRVEVSGSLPAGAVQRAVERRRPAIARCTPALPTAVVAHFRIGEARRAQGVTAAGASDQINGCIAAALADVRTEAAPDVGDVEVTVRIAFAVKT
ncbi:MAG TPA: serine/threonine-protein kinase [Kofleriaceae bacterium]